MYRICRAFALSLLVCAPVSHADSVFVDVRKRVQTTSDVIHLRDVADIVSADAAAVARLANTPIAIAGQIVDAGGLQRQDLEKALAPTAQLLGVDLVWGGAAHVQVAQPERAVDFWPAIDAAAREILMRLPNGAQAEIIVVKAPDPFKLDAAFVRIEPDLNALALDGKYVSLPLRVLAGDVDAGMGTVVFEVRPKEKSVGRKATSHTLGAMAPRVGKHDASPASEMSVPVIHRKDRVRIQLRAGGVSIESEGRALADARVGQTVRVKRASGGVFTARAVAPGVVEVGVN